MAKPGGMEMSLIGQTEKKAWTRLLRAAAENISVPPYPSPSSALHDEFKPKVMIGVCNP